MKFSRIPRLHILSDFRQLRHRPRASSHFRCLSRQVKHPVRTRLALVSTISEDFLRFALDWRGELLFCFGVAGFGFAFGGACDCDFAWDRVVRFISFFVLGFFPFQQSDHRLSPASYLVAGADWSGRRPSRSRGLVYAESPCQVSSNGHVRIPRVTFLVIVLRGILPGRLKRLRAKSKNLRPGEGLARFSAGRAHRPTRGRKIGRDLVIDRVSM